VIETPVRIRQRVLNVGSGPSAGRRLHSLFAPNAWDEIRLDIDPGNEPDIVGSVIDMRMAVGSQSCDAIWCSHILEHLYAHQVPAALAEFQRVLRPDGFALISCPDLEAVAEVIVSEGLDHEAYRSPAGPITPLDMLFGYSPAIAQGHVYMAHKTGFTCARLGQLLADCGFPTVLAKRDEFDLWALALMGDAAQQKILQELQRGGLDLLDESN
jgi:SAM-dependent methyltransferase